MQYVFELFLCCFKKLANCYVNLLQTQIYCYKVNHTAREKVVYLYISLNIN
jgi:hypothetical protein